MKDNLREFENFKSFNSASGVSKLTTDERMTSVEPKFHLVRHDTFDVSSPCILAVSSLSNSTARHVERVVT